MHPGTTSCTEVDRGFAFIVAFDGEIMSLQMNRILDSALFRYAFRKHVTAIMIVLLVMHEVPH